MRSESTGVSVGVGRPSEAGALASIARQSLPDPWGKVAFLKEFERESSRISVLRDERSQPLGYVLGWRVGDEIQILSLAVDPSCRRLGYGRLLMDSYLERMRNEGAETVTLEVRESNRAAQALYRSVGMAPQGRRPRFYSDGETALIYGATL
jgi:ribosomal-protein-alanine N-acetyltransferase